MAKVILNECREITTQEYCDITDKRDLKFEGQTRVNSEGIYWIIWNDNDELLKIKCSLNYFEPNIASSQEEYDSNEEYYESKLQIT